MFGSNISSYATELSNLNQEDINNLSKGNSITIRFMDENLEITPDMVDIRVNSKEGYDAAYLNDNFIVIDTKLTDELILEGVAREIVSKVQNLRKDSGFEVENRIKLYYDGDLDDVLAKYSDYIKKETLSLDIIKTTLDTENYDINGREVKLKVEKIK
jgi:isoleucyl-tRNA synthetase